MSKTISIDINLAPKDPFFETLPGQMLRWALSIGRYIVIFTELVVILSFVSRFSLDRQITDLNDAIFQKQTIIQSFGDLENNVRTTQEQIENYLQVRSSAEFINIFPALQQITPPGVELSQLIIQVDSVNMTGFTTSQTALNTLIANLELSPNFAEITVDKIESAQDREGYLLFAISAVPIIGEEAS